MQGCLAYAYIADAQMMGNDLLHKILESGDVIYTFKEFLRTLLDRPDNYFDCLILKHAMQEHYDRSRDSKG